jgi:hypothetical protein
LLANKNGREQDINDCKSSAFFLLIDTIAGDATGFSSFRSFRSNYWWWCES